jgi:hypothetical protein
MQALAEAWQQLRLLFGLAPQD